MTRYGGYDIALQFARGLEQLRARYFLGGSMAASLQGPPRFTQDIDFVIELAPEAVPTLAHALGSEFDVDEEALADALRQRRSWNIFHISTATRIDIFARGESPFDHEEMARARPQLLPDGSSLMVKSPEDTVLRKLLWFQAGQEANSQQFRDVVAVLQFQGERIDREYLRRWAPRLGLESLLARAIQVAER